MSDLRGYYDQSYPPSLWENGGGNGGATPEGNLPTGVVPGSPGSFIPDGSDIPADVTELRMLGPLGQTDPWAPGQYVLTADGLPVYWSGTLWASGYAPTG